MRILRPTIASRLIVLILGCSLIFVIVGTALQLLLDYSREMRMLDTRVRDIERSYVPAMENSLWLADWEMLRVQVEGVQRLPEIRFVAVVADGRRVAAVGSERAEGAIRHVFPLLHRYKGESLSLGMLTIHADADAVRQRMLDHFFQVVVFQVITTCFIVVILFFLFHFLVGRHLQGMAEYLRAFDQGRMETPLALDKKSPASREAMDEIDQVVYSFNEMRQNLKRSFDSQHQVNVDLLRENRERLKAEESLRESEQRYSLLVNNIQEAFWMVSADYRQVFFISPAFERIWGRSCESLRTNPRLWFESVVAEDQPAVAAVIDTMTRGEDLPEQIEFPEYRVKRPDSTLCWIKAKAVPLRNEAGRLWGFAGLCEDITSRKESEQKLRQAQKMEAIGTLAGGIAHDFNNILAAILGYADLARYGMAATDPYRKHIEQIIRAGNRAKALIQQILAFSRKTEHQRRPVMVAPIIKEALKLLRASIPTTIEIEPRIYEAGGTVLADPIQLHQVVVNLCTNASQAMEEQGGTLTVALDVVDVDPEEADGLGGQPGHYVRLTVADTGCGMDEATRQRIFDPYFTTKEFGKGSGMGLAVVNGIVQGYGGMVRVASQVGSGTTFEVFFPAVDLPPEPEITAITSCPPGNERILLVDDEPAITDMAKQWLTRFGYRVVAVNSSLEARALFRDDPEGFDLLVTDQTMPHLPGSELAKEVLAIRPELPILLCTGYSSIVTEEKAREIGIRRYAHKPLSGSELGRIVRQMLDERVESSPAG